MATAIGPGSIARAYTAARETPVRPLALRIRISTPGKSASGNRFGRVRIAAAAAAPASAVLGSDGSLARRRAISHQVIAGTSLIGHTRRDRKIGLASSVTLASAPT